MDPLSPSVREILVFPPLPDPFPPDTCWNDAVRIWRSFLLSQFAEDLLGPYELSPDDCRGSSRASALLVPWGPLCVRLVRAKLDSVLYDVEQLERTHVEVDLIPTGKVHALEQLGPQFSLTSVVHDIQSHLAIVDDADRPVNQRYDSEEDVVRRLQEVNVRIMEIASEVRSIVK